MQKPCGTRWAALSRFVVAEATLGEALQRLAAVSTRAIPGAQSARITLLEEGRVVAADAGAYWDARELSEQLNQAMRTRSIIEQARGVLMARIGIDAEGAFEVLRKASQRENVKLYDIAERIVRSASHP